MTSAAGSTARATARPAFRIGLLGHGTVGGSFAQLVSEQAETVEASCGRRPEIAGVLTRTRGDFHDILSRSDLVVEVMGGTEPARSHILEALRAGRHVVTANKQVVSQYGEELLATADEAGVQLRYEAAVAGVVPVIRVMEESLAGAHIDKVHGIVNGTTNYILTEMSRTGADFHSALRKAQDMGYAEANPTDDVTGRDAAAKMAILARLAFGCAVHLDQVEFEGIENIKPDDISYAREFGLALKLLGIADRVKAPAGDGIAVRVFPCFIGSDHPLAPVVGAFNAVTVESSAITEITLSGPGAGGPQTASAILGDVVSAMTGDRLRPKETAEIQVVPGDELRSSFYLHLEVADVPGVLAKVAERLGAHGVSVKSAVQRGLGERARLVMVMHEVEERRFGAALAQIAELDVLRAPPRAIRVLEEAFE